EITGRVGAVAYRLALPSQLSGVHNIFHVSMLRKCGSDIVPVIDWQSLEVREDASYIEQPVRILDRKEQVLRTKVIPLVKVQWGHHSVD
ncbi:hypothetical protein PJP12_29775, partial [Mycobacterium kansasii]